MRQSHASVSKSAQKRVLIFIILLCGIVALCSVFFGYLLLNAEEKDHLASTERALLVQAQERVAKLTTWSGNTQSIFESLAQSDLLCLFAYEMQKQGDGIKAILAAEDDLKTVQLPRNSVLSPKSPSVPGGGTPPAPDASVFNLAPQAGPVGDLVVTTPQSRDASTTPAPVTVPKPKKDNTKAKRTAPKTDEVAAPSASSVPAASAVTSAMSVASPAQGGAMSQNVSPTTLPASAQPAGTQATDNTPSPVTDASHTDIDRNLNTPAKTQSVAAPETDKQELVRQLPSIRKVLADLVQTHKLIAVTMVTSDFTPYLSSGRILPVLNEAEKKGIEQVLKSGKAQIMPARRASTGRLVTDAIIPLFPPDYVIESKVEIAGVMIATMDVTDLVQSLEERANNSIIVCRIIQQGVEGLVDLPGTTGEKEIILHGWRLDAEGGLPFAIRSVATQKVYSLGVQAQGVPWVIATDIPVNVARQPYEHYRQMVLIILTAATLILLLCVCVGWWWLIGQRERAMRAHVDELYKQNSQSKLLVESINNNLTDAIVLKDAGGRILFCNNAYAGFFGKLAVDITGENANKLMSTMTNLPVNPYTQKVLEEGTTETYTEILLLEKGRSSFQVVSSPYCEEDGARGVVSVYQDVTNLLAAQERTQKMAFQTIEVLVRAIEAADPYLAGQSTRLGELAQALVKMMGLSKEHVATVRAAASLSQVGMLQVPAEVRAKVGKLTQEERQLLRQHVDFAQNMLEGIDFGLPVQQAIYQMYEYMDGTGYPRGLKGDEICIDARILAVANTFCALLRPRAYRQARTIEDALSILSLDTTQYDTEVVRILHVFLRGPLGKKFVDSVLERG